MIRQVEIQVKSGEVTALLLFDLLDMKLGKYHATFRMIRVWEREEPFGPKVLFSNLFRRHLGQFFPGHPLWQFGPDTFLDGPYSPRHHNMLGRPIA